MSAAADKSDNQKEVPSQKSTVVLLFTIAADTTWRMFVPIISFTLGGVWSDNTITQKPFGTITGIVIGVAVAALLVRQQIRKKL